MSRIRHYQYTESNAPQSLPMLVELKVDPNTVEDSPAKRVARIDEAFHDWDGMDVIEHYTRTDSGPFVLVKKYK